MIWAQNLRGSCIDVANKQKGRIFYKTNEDGMNPIQKWWESICMHKNWRNWKTWRKTRMISAQICWIISWIAFERIFSKSGTPIYKNSRLNRKKKGHWMGKIKISLHDKRLPRPDLHYRLSHHWKKHWVLHPDENHRCCRHNHCHTSWDRPTLRRANPDL